MCEGYVICTSLVLLASLITTVWPGHRGEAAGTCDKMTTEHFPWCSGPHRILQRLNRLQLLCILERCQILHAASDPREKTST
jgi:hypothetical protein